MAKFFLDQEFIAGFHKPLFGKKRHFIDLISVGLVSEDGRTYYAISNELDLKYIWNNKDTWVKNNVLKPIWTELCKKQSMYAKTYHYSLFEPFTIGSMRNLIKWHGKSNKQITHELFRFIHADIFIKYDDHISFFEEIIESAYTSGKEAVHEFYGYYADYDWVLFCSLFGSMNDLPKGFPMYCIDLKQTIDEKAHQIANNQKSTAWNFDYALDWIKKKKNYPVNVDEHNALADAEWNKKLYEFLQGFKK